MKHEHIFPLPLKHSLLHSASGFPWLYGQNNVCSHSARGFAGAWPGSEDCRSECIIILNYLDGCRNCKTADIMFIIEVIRKSTVIWTECKPIIRRYVFLVPFINGFLYYCLGQTVSCNRIIRITRDVLLENWPRTSWFKFKYGSSRTQRRRLYRDA